MDRRNAEWPLSCIDRASGYYTVASIARARRQGAGKWGLIMIGYRQAREASDRTRDAREGSSKRLALHSASRRPGTEIDNNTLHADSGSVPAWVLPKDSDCPQVFATFGLFNLACLGIVYAVKGRKVCTGIP